MGGDEEGDEGGGASGRASCQACQEEGYEEGNEGSHEESDEEEGLSELSRIPLEGPNAFQCSGVALSDMSGQGGIHGNCTFEVCALKPVVVHMWSVRVRAEQRTKKKKKKKKKKDKKIKR